MHHQETGNDHTATVTFSSTDGQGHKTVSFDLEIGKLDLHDLVRLELGLWSVVSKILEEQLRELSK